MKRFDRYYNKSLPPGVGLFLCDPENKNRTAEEFVIRLLSLNFEFNIDNFILLLTKTFTPYGPYLTPRIVINVVNETDEFEFIKEEDNANLLKEFIHYTIRSRITISSWVFELLKAIDNKYGTRFQHFLSTEVLKLDNVKFSRYKRHLEFVTRQVSAII